MIWATVISITTLLQLASAINFNDWMQHLNNDLCTIYHQAAEFAWDLR